MTPTLRKILLSGLSTSWARPTSLIDADIENGKFYFHGKSYKTQADWLTALSGSISGAQYTIGPKSQALLYQSDFSAGVDGWIPVSGYEAGGSISASNNKLNIAPTAAYRAEKAISVSNYLAAKITGTNDTNVGISVITLNGGSSAALSSSATIAANMSGYTQKSFIGASGPSALYVGVIAGSSGSASFSEFSATEVYPYLGYIPGQVSFEIDASMPASFATKEVIAQWGVSAELFRVRVEVDTSGQINVIVTSGNTAQASLNLGTVSTSSRHIIRATLKANGFYANLDGGVIQSDVSGVFPGIGMFWIGRSFTGEAFDGSIHRLTIYPDAKSSEFIVDSNLAFVVFGDSTAAGYGATTYWFSTLSTDYTPGQSMISLGVGGENTAQMLARVVADTTYSGRKHIFMDRPNTGETSSEWIANIKLSAASQGSQYWFVVPPVQDYPDTSITNIAEVQAALLSDSFFDGHTFTSGQQASYITLLNDGGTRADGTHMNDSGQAIQAAAIKAALDALSWP